MWGEQNHPLGEKEHLEGRGHKEKGEQEPLKPAGREKAIQKALQPDDSPIKVHLFKNPLRKTGGSCRKQPAF